MMRLLTILKILLVLLLVTSPCLATDYYVKTNGNNALSGQDWDNAWETIVKVNSVNPDAGSHTVTFRPGDTFVGTILRLSNWNNAYTNVTIQGADGDGKTIAVHGKPILDTDNTLAGISIGGSVAFTGTIAGNLTIKDIQCVGSEGGTALNQYLNYFASSHDIENLVLDGFDGIGDNMNARTFLRIVSIDGNIEIKNSTITDWCGEDDCGIADWGASQPPGCSTNLSQCGFDAWPPCCDDYVGIHIGHDNASNNDASDAISIHDNVIRKINSDLMAIGQYGGDSISIYENDLFDFGENALDMQGAGNGTTTLNIYSNRIRDQIGAGGNYSTTKSLAIMTHALRDKTANDVFPYSAINIYDNYFYNLDEWGIYISGDFEDSIDQANVKIYNNRFNTVEVPVVLLRETAGAEVHHNDMYIAAYNDVDTPDFSSLYAAITTGTTEEGNEGLIIHNNSIYIDSSQSIARYGIFIDECNGASGTTIKNNLIEMERSNVEVYPIYVADPPASTTIDYNTWHGAHANRVYYDGDTYTNCPEPCVGSIDDWINDEGGANELFAEPPFTDKNNADLTLLRPMNNGFDPGSPYNSSYIDPDSNFSELVISFLTNVNTTERGAYGWRVKPGKFSGPCSIR